MLMLRNSWIPPSKADARFFTVLTNLGLTTNLKLCLDSGDEASYTSGQKFLDRSGGGYDFFFGADATAAADDPTFNGVAGAVSSAEYMSFDGGDFFLYDTANETWMQNIHKDGFTGGIAAWVYCPASGGLQSGTYNGASANIGFGFVVGTGDHGFRTAKAVGGGVYALLKSGDAFPNASAWNFAAVSINENGGNVSFLYLNGAYNQVSAANTFDAAYSSPSAAAATTTMGVGSNGGTTADKASSGTRLGGYVVWEGTAPTKANFDSFFATTRTRYGI